MNTTVTAPHVKPCTLEVYRAGRWVGVLDFDAAADHHSDGVMATGDMLGAIDPAVQLRVVTRDALKVELMVYSLPEGWRVAS